MDKSLGHNAPYSLQGDYLGALVSGSGRAADRVVETALAIGVTPQRIYLEIFQPTAYEIGRLWQHNKVSVAGEHLATAIIERQMGELQPLFQPPRDRRRTLVLGCVPDEWHRVGARMVADFLKADGWAVHYLGANAPIADLVGIAREASADLVGLSAEMLFNLGRVSELVQALDRAGLGGIPVIAGGMPFIESPDLPSLLNLRGSANDAEAAVALANAIVGAGPAPALPALRGAATQALRRAGEQIVAAATERCAVAGDPDTAQIATGYARALRLIEGALGAPSAVAIDQLLADGAGEQPLAEGATEEERARLRILGEEIQAHLEGEAGALVIDWLEFLSTWPRQLIRL